MTKKQLEKIIKEEGDSLDFEFCELPCFLIRHAYSKHWCGYVQVPKESRLFGKPYYINSESELGLSPLEESLNNICVHGGLTYAGDRKNDGNWCFGFDTIHLGDLSLLDFMYSNFRSRGDETYKDKNYCIEECKNLAEQLKKIIDLNL